VSRADDRAAVFLTSVTWLRVLLTPVVMAFVLAGGDTNQLIAGALFAVAALTDLIDGLLARRWKQTSPLGAFLDTTADKILVAGGLLALVSVGRASVWASFLIIGREILILGLKGVASAEKGDAVPPSWLGKAKANLQFIAITVAIVRPDVVIGPWYLDAWLLWAAALASVWSGADYLIRYGGLVSRRRDR
jgi:CDP-diacylglycerol--glycerol-3-phosphate 3-phosphatidyltransferase